MQIRSVIYIYIMYCIYLVSLDEQLTPGKSLWNPPFKITLTQVASQKLYHKDTPPVANS